MKKCRMMLLCFFVFIFSIGSAFADSGEQAIPDSESKEIVTGYSIGIEYSPQSRQHGESVQNIFRKLAIENRLLCIKKEIMSRKGINSKETLSEFLSPEDQSLFTEKGVSADEIKVYVTPIRCVVTNNVTASRGPDTVSYDKSVSYSADTVLGRGNYRMRIKWDANKVTGACTLIYRKLTFLSGLNYNTWVGNSFNPYLLSTYDYFDETTKASTLVSFSANSSGHITVI